MKKPHGFTEVQLSDTPFKLSPPPDGNSLIITTRPSQLDLDRAEKENKMVFSFIHTPDCVVDDATGKAWLQGWMLGCGIKASPYLSVWFVPKNLDLESVARALQRKWDERRDDWAYDGLRPMAGLCFGEWLDSEPGVKKRED